jgi:hypothetical protein
MKAGKLGGKAAGGAAAKQELKSAEQVVPAHSPCRIACTFHTVAAASCMFAAFHMD